MFFKIYKCKLKKYKLAFTLAEVLITLGVVGILATLTIPTLVHKYQDKKTVTILKETYALLSQAYLKTADNGPPETWDWSKAPDLIMSNLNLARKCGKGEGCFANETYKTLAGQIFQESINPSSNKSNNAKYKYLLSNGVSVMIRPWQGKCTTNCGNGNLENSFCAYVIVDINGEKAPNQFGIDTFTFLATKYDIYPSGLPRATSACGYIGECTKSSSKYCGRGCTAWVLEKQNLDYLRGKKIKW